MNSFLAQLAVRAATIDELLSDDFEEMTGQKGDTDAAGRRLAAWCRAAASGDWALFAQRLERDGWSFAKVLTRLATVRRAPGARPPAWLADAEWIDAAFTVEVSETRDGHREGEEPLVFEHLFAAVAEEAEKRLWNGISGLAADNFTAQGRRSMRRALIARLSELCSGALYERFQAALKAEASDADPAGAGAARYPRFVDDMRREGLHRLFEQKPVLLRLIATVVRQWIDTTRELIERFDTDLPQLRRELLETSAGRATGIEGELSDPHNEGHSVQVLLFEDGKRLVYKPKDLRVDAAWQAVVECLNRSSSPVELRPVRALACDGYGWTEFIGHSGCADWSDFDLFFGRAGAWLALFHVFASADMHDENMIADGDHPVPIDLETILQATTPENESDVPERQALDLAARRTSESVMTTGLLPSYGRTPENRVYGLGGLMAREGSRYSRAWEGVNSDTMRRTVRETPMEAFDNLPHLAGKQASLGDHVAALVEGYEAYATFLLRLRDSPGGRKLFEGFAGCQVRKILRPTRFYYVLMQRLRDHRTMDDGSIWSAQADFLARLADWNRADDPLWPLQSAERAALLALNVPHFVSPTDADTIASPKGMAIHTGAVPGLVRARDRFGRLDDADIAWQIDVIRQSTIAVPRTEGAAPSRAQRAVGRFADVRGRTDRAAFLAEAAVAFEHLSKLAIRSGPGAAWLGLDSLGGSDVSQLVPLGYDLYNGSLGIALFLAAYAKTTGDARAGDLALAAIASLRKELYSPAAARLARSLGTGGTFGLGSVVYGLTTIAGFLDDESVLAAAATAAGLFSRDLIVADKALDVMGGSAGGILCLLKLHRATGVADVLARAMQCGDHLLAQRKFGAGELRCWVGQGMDNKPLNGMSHGAAGFAYALASLATASGEARFAAAARDCIAFENASFSAEHNDWLDLRSVPGKAESRWPCQWCHGAAGIGLARLGMLRLGAGGEAGALRRDVERALTRVKAAWPNAVDTLCCGTLGTVELLSAAGQSLQLNPLRDLASEKMAMIAAAAAKGDYAFSGGDRQFNIGLFRGMAGIGYTLLRQVDETLPSVVIWE